MISGAHTIRPVSENDAESIAELLNPIIEANRYTIMENGVSEAGQLDFIRGFPDRGVFHVAIDNNTGRVVGMQDVMPITPPLPALRHVGEISTFVSLAAHRQGIARSLSAATFPAARERGFAKIIAMIRADNPDALAFYRSQGFEIIGTAKKHARVRGTYVDEVFTEKLLD